MAKTIETYEDFVKMYKNGNCEDVIDAFWKTDRWLANVWYDRMIEEDTPRYEYETYHNTDDRKSKDDDFEIGSDFYMWTLNNQ